MDKSRFIFEAVYCLPVFGAPAGTLVVGDGIIAPDVLVAAGDAV
jgi:hypothetical protein